MTSTADLTAAVTAGLHRSGVAEFDSSALRRAEYATDASNYRVVPQVVVFPRDADEVAASISVAAAHGVAVTARGAGTSCAGNAVGTGLVLDFSRYLNRIVSLDPEQQTAVVQPGVVLADLQRASAGHGLRFGPDPSTQSRCTLGGMIGNNACGPHALAYGRSADNVVDLTLALAGGRSVTAATVADLVGLGDPIGVQLERLVADNLSVIRTEFDRFIRQISGYSMQHLLPENGGRLANFLAGTEGTLGVLTQATVRLVRAAPATALVVLGYPDMPTAADDVPALLPLRPLAIEGMDARLVAVLKSRRGAAAVPELPAGAGWLFVETGGETEAAAIAAAQTVVAAANPVSSAVVTGAAARQLWRIREDGAGLGGRTPAGAPAWPGWEDSAVPPDRLGGYLRELTVLFEQHGVDGLMYGHFGDGCMHARLDFPLDRRPGVFREFLLDAAKLVAAHGGSMSGEHGDGRARSELLPLMYSPSAIALFGAVKHIFDPANVLNPGVIVDPAPLDADLRLTQLRPMPTRGGFSYEHDHGDFVAAVHRCTGVGKCRADNSATGGVMCPSYLATKDETHSTRGRARVLQEMVNGGVITDGWRSAEVEQALDLCLSCKGCTADCPAGVDMATYKSEVLYQRYRRRLRPASHYALGWLPRWAKLATRMPRIANGSLRLKPVAALLKKLGGIDQRRPLPQFAAESFRRWFGKRPVAEGTPVWLWVDTFTNAFSPEVGQAAVTVLEAAGYSVRITQRSVCCGLTWISTGQLDGARRQLRAAFDALAEPLSTGAPIVGLEPSCTAALRSDALELLPDDPRAVRLAAQLKTFAELLTSSDWQLPSLVGTNVLAQPHCHQHAVLGFGADEALLAGAGAQVSTVGGCCGLAGNFGVEQGHYDVSVAVAELQLLPAVRAVDAETAILADGFSCRTQLEQLSDRRGIHLAQLVADTLQRASVRSED